MKKIIEKITNFCSSKSGSSITILIWVVAIIILTIASPKLSDYKVATIPNAPDSELSMIAKKKVDTYFPNSNKVPAIVVLKSAENILTTDKLLEITNKINALNLSGVDSAIPFANLPPQALNEFIASDQSAMFIPYQFAENLESEVTKSHKEKIEQLGKDDKEIELYITGPVGISVDTVSLFNRADFVLLLGTVTLILVLLILIYRSPLLALIPLVASGLVYLVITSILAIMAKNGTVVTDQAVSIASILLFAAVTDYSLFIYARYNANLRTHHSRYAAMIDAMAKIGFPVFFAGGTVLITMLLLFFAKSGDYKSFAPVFSVVMAVIMFASITLVPAIFVLFGRKAFWPRVPKVNLLADKQKKTAWRKIATIVVKKPIVSLLIMLIFLGACAANITNLKYEFNLIKTFPSDMPSRIGYEILEENFIKGNLAPTTVVLELSDTLSMESLETLMNEFKKKKMVENVQFIGFDKTAKAAGFTLTFIESPYSVEAINFMEKMIADKTTTLKNSNIKGKLYFAGETARLVDEREMNKRDTFVIISLQVALILGMLIFMTRSFKIPLFMLGTILISFVATIGLSLFLTDRIFEIDAFNTRVPLYAFVFLVALGIDYNIILVSHYQEERLHNSVKDSVCNAVADTGGVISSAGLILAGTFAVLMTMPIELLSIFGFTVAVGIILDTFFVRGVLLPALIVMIEKDKTEEVDLKNVLE